MNLTTEKKALNEQLNKIDILQIPVSWQSRVFYTKDLRTVKLEHIFNEIKSSQELKELVSKLRLIKNDDDQQNYKKSNFPYFNLGTFRNSHRLDENLISTSFFIFDYDHLDENLESMKTQLKEDKSIFAFFLSPRGNGLKVILRLDNPVTDHNTFSKLYRHYAEIYRVNLGANPDKTCDASRACFFSNDPDMYINLDSVPLATDVVIDETEPVIIEKDSGQKLDDLISNLKGTTPGNRTQTAQQLLGNFIAKGLNKDLALEILRLWNKQNNPPHEDEKLVSMTNDMYKRYNEKADTLPVKFSENGNAYYKVVKNGKNFSRVMVTSFKITPKELLTLDTSDCLKCDIVTSQNNCYENVLIENTDWHTKQKFLKALGHQDCVFLGSENDLQALCQFTQTSIPVRKTGTKMIGLQEDTWVIDGLNITREGKSKELKIVPYEKGTNAFYHRIAYRELSPSDYSYMLGSFYDYILKTNERSKILAYLGWIFAVPVKPKVEEELNAFPLLFQHGGHGSGKTSQAKLLARLQGYRDPSPNSVTMKSFPMLKMLSSTNAIAQWYDEFKVSDMKEADVDNILRYMRKAYAGEVESKGKADQTIESYKLSAPMAVMGEWNINQPAIMERVILIRSGDVIKKDTEMQRAFRTLQGLELEGFMPEYIRYCMNQNIKDLIQTAISYVGDHFRHLTVAPRIINNLSVMVMGLELFRGLAHYNRLIVPEINYDKLLDDQLEELTGSKKGMVRSAVDQLVEELSVMAEKHEIEANSDFKIVGTKAGIRLLAIKFRKVFRDFKVHAKKTDYEGDLLDESSYSRLFDECDYVFHKSYEVKFNGKTQKCLCIDIEKAQNAGIALEGFLGCDNPDGYLQLPVVTTQKKPDLFRN